MSIFTKIEGFFVHLWTGLTEGARKALPLLESGLNILKTIDATNIPADILTVVAGPVAGTAIEAGFKSTLTAISTGIAKAAGLAAETPQEALTSVVGILDKAKNDKGTKTLLLSGMATQLFAGVTNTPVAHASAITQLHYTGELQDAIQNAAQDEKSNSDDTNKLETSDN